MPLTAQQQKLLKGNQGIVHSRLVSLVLPAGNTTSTVFFEDQPDLRYSRIIAVEVLVRGVANPSSGGDLLKAPPLNSNLILGADLRQIAISFETNDADLWDDSYAPGKSLNDEGRFRQTGVYIKWLPLVTLHRLWDNSTRYGLSVYQLFELNNIFITWSKSFLSIPNPSALSGNDLTVALQVYYTFRSINGRLIPHK